MVELGRLSAEDPRSVWQSEATDFTPWLLENADRLAEALGIDVELTGTEYAVGGYALDLIGTDLTNDAPLIVENQLAGTDHSHLGQLLTYAAGTAAGTIIWIATEFREEHRQALDWLNENTGEDTRFFGVRLSVVRIGESQPAPLFDLAAQPNDWQKRTRASATSGRRAGKSVLYERFWSRFLDRLRLEHPSWSRARKAPTQNWFSTVGPIRGTLLAAVFAGGGRIRYELYIDSGDVGVNLSIFETLQSQREVFEHIYGRPLEWEGLAERRAKRIAEYSAGDVANDDRHNEFIDWFLDCGVRFRRALSAGSGVKLPDVTDLPVRTHRDWSLLHDALDSIQPGEWVSYGDLARLIGTMPQPLGQHVRDCPDCPRPYRVLNASGHIAENFQWSDPLDDRDPREVLEGEGLAFTAGVADPDARVDLAELRRRLRSIESTAMNS